MAWAVALIMAAGCMAGAQDPVLPGTTPRSETCRSVVDDSGSALPVAIPWTQAPSESDRARLAGWCAAVGPAVIRPLVASTGEPPDASGTLAFVSWNIHVDGGDLPALVRALRAGSLTGGRPVGHFVLLIQEAGRGGSVVPLLTSGMPAAPRVDERGPDPNQDIVQVARSLNLALFYVASMRNGRETVAADREDLGCAILSSLPLTGFAAVELPFGRRRRVSISAQLEGADGLRVAAVHLDASVDGRRLWVFSSGVRGRQARHLVRTFASEKSLVVGADLNTWSEGPAEPAYREFARAFPQSARPKIAPTFRLPWLVDYMFFRLPEGWTGTAGRAEGRYGSDHHPIVGVITKTPGVGFPPL